MNTGDRFTERDLSALIMGEGSPAERREIEEAIEASPELRRQYESLRKTWDLLAAYHAPDPPAGGLEDLRRRMKVRPLERRKRPLAGTRRRVGIAVGAAGVMLAAGISAYFLLSGEADLDIVPARPPVAVVPPEVRPEVASLAGETHERRFLAGEDGNLWAGATMDVGSMAEWSEPVIHVQHMDDLNNLNLEDYAVTNYEFRGQGSVPARPEVVPVSAVPVSTDPL